MLTIIKKKSNIFQNKTLLLFPFIIGILLYFILLTPQICSDIFFGLNFENIKLIYVDIQNNNFVKYVFNHRYYDGILMKHVIENNLVNYQTEITEKLYPIQNYQFLNTQRIQKFTLFTSCISHFLYDILQIQRRKLNICIIVSTRNKMKNTVKKGNFIKVSSYSVYPNNSKIDICQAHTKAVLQVKLKNQWKNNSTGIDLLKTFLNVDYIFDSWRELSYIKTKDNKYLVRQFHNKITKQDILNLKYKDNCKFIYLDFLYNKYIISRIKEFERKTGILNLEI
jgi:hypothetical protein